MTKLQLAVIASAVALFLAIYIGCETKPKNMRALEKSRALVAESTNLDVLLREAKTGLSSEQRAAILTLEQQLTVAPDDSMRVRVLEELARQWFAAGNPAVSGAYAEQIAELRNTDESWSIAATTFTLCVQRVEEEKVKSYCSDQAVRAYENAISLNPGSIAYKVNLALLYADHPPADNPMKGITMLLDLNRESPENVLVLNTLGRLAIRTGQFDRAIERLEKALSLAPDNSTATCLLAQAYAGAGDTAKAGQWAEKCQMLNKEQKGSE